MPPLTARRLRFATAAAMAEALHLGWEALHGGIVTHHLLQRADLPGLSNAWGLLLLPVLAAWAAGRWPSPGSPPRAGLAPTLGLLLPLLLGGLLSAAFTLHLQSLTEAVFFGLMLLALLLPAQRPECLLGFVLGMSWTFGALLPTVIGSLILGVSWAARRIARWAWRAVRPS